MFNKKHHDETLSLKQSLHVRRRNHYENEPVVPRKHYRLMVQHSIQ
jgi:hypothetical protein